ncbi:MAG: acyl-CoA dehydrogenase family protein [Planctomycetes bacterium]|nr:acyl-CoA dehydrogenase family protein [Planctomycetota bacterium]
MIYNLSEEQQLLKDTAGDFADKVLAPISGTIDKEEKIPDAIIAKLAEMGFWGIMVPEKYGGAGLDTFSLMLVLEQISRACASTSVTLSVHNSLACNAINKYGTEEQKQKYLPKLAAGQIIGAYSLTEPDAGSDAASIKAHARFDGKNYILNGVKEFVTSGPIAGVIVLFARTDSQAVNNKGISAFLVEPGFKGVTRGKREEKMGVRGAPMCEIALEDAVVPKANLLGQENKGFEIAMDALNCGRIGIAIQSVGIAQSALDMAVKYAKERKQFGKFLNEFQAVKWKLAEMATEIEAARLLAYQTALMRDQGVPYVKEASMAKLFASGVVNRATKESLQIHGGMGYTKDFAIERLFRDSKVTEIYEGTSEVQHLVISRFLI